MVKRQTTLKKKVSKRQTRKFSKKGGRKSMKKPASKQQKIKGGLITMHKSSAQRRRDNNQGANIQEHYDKERFINIVAEDYLKKLDDIHNRYYTSDKQTYDNEIEILAGSYEEKLTPTMQYEMMQTAADSMINRNSRDRKKDSIKIIEILKKCNKDGEGKSILKTPFTGRDYIKSKFRIKEKQDRLYLVMKDKGDAKSEEIESTIGPDYFHERVFLITKKLHDEIKVFLDSDKFNGKESKEDGKETFLNNVLQSIHPSMR